MSGHLEELPSVPFRQVENYLTQKIGQDSVIPRERIVYIHRIFSMRKMGTGKKMFAKQMLANEFILKDVQ